MGDSKVYSEDELIEGCIRNDRRFQEVLYRKYARKMYGICLGYAGERPLAQDMLQEAFIKVFRNIESFTKKGSLEGWIRRIVTNTAIDLIRRQPAGDQLFIENSNNSGENTFNKALSDMETRDILDHIAKLPQGARMVFNLYALEGFTHQEIADKLSISAGTSKSQFNRARQLLQQWLEQPN